MKKAICVLSGGMDSSVCSYIAKSEGYDIVTLHFNYGQKTQSKELEAFNNISKDAGAIKKVECNLDFLSQIGGSALTDSNISVPTSGVDETIIPITYVPFRNGIFLSLACSLAEREGASAIYIGVVEEDSSGYPDCSDEFISSINKSMNLGTRPETNIEIKTPLVHLQKKEIVKVATKYNVPLELTWSCYKDEEEACGECDSCRLRLRGFELAGKKDPIKYK